MAIIFTFNAAVPGIRAGTIPLAAGTFYAHLVTAEPLVTHTVVSDLSIISYPAYAPTVLTSQTFTGGVWKFANLQWPVVNGSSDVTTMGFVICQQMGGSPASTDPLIVFSRIKILGVPVTITASPGERVKVDIDQTNGILNTLDKYTFQAGNFSTYGDTNGLFYMMGTRNGRQAWQSPRTLNQIDLIIPPIASGSIASNNGVNQVNSVRIFDRSVSPDAQMNANNTYMNVFSFKGGRLLNLKDAKFAMNAYHSGAFVYNFYGAKGFTNADEASEINNTANWTYLGSFTTNTGVQQYYGPFALNQSVDDFFPYIGYKLSPSGNYYTIAELEIYDAILASNTADLT